MAEHAAVNRGVAGSSPAGGERKKERNRVPFFFLSLLDSDQLHLGKQPFALKSERHSLSAAVNWNRSERRRGREERGEIRAAVGKVEVTTASPKRFSGTAS